MHWDKEDFISSDYTLPTKLQTGEALQHIFFQAAQISYGQRLCKRKCNPGFHWYTCKRSHRGIHSFPDQTVPKENTWTWHEENLAHESLPTLGVPLQFWRRFVYSLLITLAKIDQGSLVTSLNTTVTCTATKFSGHRLLNKERAVSVIRSCQVWPCATVWDMTLISGILAAWPQNTRTTFIHFF